MAGRLDSDSSSFISRSGERRFRVRKNEIVQRRKGKRDVSLTVVSFTGKDGVEAAVMVLFTVHGRFHSADKESGQVFIQSSNRLFVTVSDSG